MADAEPIEQLRRALPQLLREHPEVRHELWGLMLETFSSCQEWLTILEDLRATNRVTILFPSMGHEADRVESA